MATLMTGLATGGPSSGAVASAPPPDVQLWEVLRLSSGPSKLALDVQVGFEDSRALIAMASLRDFGGLTRPVGRQIVASTEGSADPELYVAGAQASCAAVPGSCAFSNGGTLFALLLQDDGGLEQPEAATRVLVATVGHAPRVTVDGPGWLVRKSDGAVSTVFSDDEDAMAAGAGQFHAGAEVFLAASARGGAGGSVAMAVPPCTGVASGRLGVGSGELRGDSGSVRNTCPTDLDPAVLLSTRATQWTFTGHYTGITAPSGPGRARLVSMDLPAKQCPSPVMAAYCR